MNEISDQMPKFTEAANRINSLLWVEREAFSKRLKTESDAKTSARHDLLGEVWSRICDWGHKTGHDEWVDEAYVDGTIYEVCNEYERSLATIWSMRTVLTKVAFQIVSKQLEEYRDAISHCRYKVMTIQGRRRLGLMQLGEA